MKCKEVGLAIEQEGLLPLPPAAKAHIAECGACRDIVEDFFAIVHAAHAMPAELEPPARLWVSLRARLESEGIIRDLADTPRGSWLQAISAFFRSRALAAATVGLLILAGAFLEVRQTVNISQTEAPTVVQTGPSNEDIPTVLDPIEADLSNMMPANSMAAPVNDSLRQNLRIVNSFIADCKQRIQEDPQDDLAREYLNSAYQQKAELLAAMMDRGGSVN
ncbi:MAG TPA: anti-sigma factor [Candidatus Acidoferrales bacterium]